MKVFIVLLASVLAVSAIDSVSNTLSELSQIKNQMADYQTQVFEQIRTLRAGGSDVSARFISNYLDTAGSRVWTVGSSDLSISTDLTTAATAYPGSCITGLQANVETILRTAGYAITNCYELSDPALVDSVRVIVDSLNQLEQEVAAIELIIPDVFVSRNVFIESTAIINEVTSRFQAAQDRFNAVLASVQSQAGVSVPQFDTQMTTMRTCFDDIDASVAGGYAWVQSQIATCTKFGSRGARAIIPFNVKQFFPQLA